jgi:V8-like Glu-specific endopeptidase
MANTPRKPARRSTTRRESVAAAGPQSELDNPLYLPRLDKLALPESMLEGAGPDYSDLLESICGTTDDSQPVEQYDGTLGVTTAFVNDHQQPAVQVQWNSNLATVFTNPGDVNGVRWGSGTMISADLMLTCGHLFDSNPNGWTVPRQNGTNSAISPQQIATNMHVNFLHQVDASGTLRAEQTFAITQLIEYRLGALDMAICRIAGSPGNTYGWTEVSATDPTVGEMLAIIGHPAGQPKRIEAGPCTSVSAGSVRYNDIDTLGGNSGSGILQASTGRVVGVHTNGGCNSAGTGTNSGTAIASIRAVSPTLQALPAGSHTALAADLVATPLAQDVHTTLKSADTISAWDQVATRLSADWQGTLLSADTLKSADSIRALDTPLAGDLGTIRATDSLVASDIGTRFAGDVATRFAGDVGTGLAGDVGTGFAGDDPNTLQEVIVDPGNLAVDPPFNVGGMIGRVAGGVRPMVLAGAFQPIDEMVQGSEGGEGGTLLDELQAVIATQQALLASLEQIMAALVESLG